MRYQHSHWRAAALGSLLAMTATGALYAQTAPEETGPPAAPDEQQAAPATTTVPDAKIDQFASAYVAIQSIQSQTSQQLAATKDTKQADDLKANAETQMVQAVQKSGLQVDEFNQIATLMASDLTLRNKVLAKVQQRSRG